MFYQTNFCVSLLSCEECLIFFINIMVNLINVIVLVMYFNLNFVQSKIKKVDHWHSICM